MFVHARLHDDNRKKRYGLKSLYRNVKRMREKRRKLKNSVSEASFCSKNNFISSSSYVLRNEQDSKNLTKINLTDMTHENNIIYSNHKNDNLNVKNISSRKNIMGYNENDENIDNDIKFDKNITEVLDMTTIKNINYSFDEIENPRLGYIDENRYNEDIN